MGSSSTSWPSATRPGAIACALVDRSRIPEECIRVSDLPGLRPVGRGRAAHAAGRGDARGGILSSSPAASSVAASEGQPQGVVRRHGNSRSSAIAPETPEAAGSQTLAELASCEQRGGARRAAARGSVRRHGGSREQRGSARRAAAGQRQAPRRHPQRREQANPGRRRASEAANLFFPSLPAANGVVRRAKISRRGGVRRRGDSVVTISRSGASAPLCPRRAASLNGRAGDTAPIPAA